MTAAAPSQGPTHRPDHGRTLDLAMQLIEIEGHQDLPQQERAVAEFVAEQLSDRLPRDRSEVSLHEVGSDGYNVSAVLRGDRPGPTLLLNAHLDTVPGYGMPDAFRPCLRNDRLYGRGAVDMKGALAAMMACLEELAGRSFAGHLALVAVAGEESGSIGMQAFSRRATRADFAIVGEPTSMRIARAHKGAMWIEAVFKGVATHGSVPDEGVNAAYHAARFITAVETELAPLLSRRRHPLLGPATVSVGVVRGGDRPPMVPASCSVQLDRRWLPGETHEDVLEEVRAVVARIRREDENVQAVVREMEGTSAFVHAPLECPAEHPALPLLADVVAEWTGDRHEPVGVDFWTDGALLASRTGTPTVVCGPGDIAQAHSLEEWVAVDQLRTAVEVYVDFADRFLRGEASKERPE